MGDLALCPAPEMELQLAFEGAVTVVSQVVVSYTPKTT